MLASQDLGRHLKNPNNLNNLNNPNLVGAAGAIAGSNPGVRTAEQLSHKYLDEERLFEQKGNDTLNSHDGRAEGGGTDFDPFEEKTSTPEGAEEEDELVDLMEDSDPDVPTGFQ